MPSVRYKLISTMFKIIGINKMLDKQGAELEKLMQSYVKKQDNIKVPAEKISKAHDFEKKVIGGYDCYVTKQKGGKPKKALLYIFGGGYILPCDPGDFVLGGQFADHTGREVWFPIYPLAPRYKTVDAVKCVLAVYKTMLETHKPEDIEFFGTSSGGGLVLSVLMYIKRENLNIPMPSHLVLQSPGLQVPPSEKQYSEMQKRKNLDVMIPPNFFNEIAPYLADEDTAYLLSPLLFDISGFPSMDIIYGTHEVMIAYAEDMKKHAAVCSVPVQFHFGEGMMHCWCAMEMTPEGKQARQNIFRMINEAGK